MKKNIYAKAVIVILLVQTIVILLMAVNIRWLQWEYDKVRYDAWNLRWCIDVKRGEWMSWEADMEIRCELR